MSFVTIIITIQLECFRRIYMKTGQDEFCHNYNYNTGCIFFSVFKFRYFLLCPQEGHQLPLCRSVASREGEGNTVRNEP